MKEIVRKVGTVPDEHLLSIAETLARTDPARAEEVLKNLRSPLTLRPAVSQALPVDGGSRSRSGPAASGTG